VSTRAEIAARNKEIIAYLIAHPKETYVDVGRRFGLADRTIYYVARQYGLRLPRRTSGKVPMERPQSITLTTAERRATPKCRICGIFTEQINEGVAWVRAKKGRVRVCQDCVERYHPKYILGWIKPPVDGKEEE